MNDAEIRARLDRSKILFDAGDYVGCNRILIQLLSVVPKSDELRSVLMKLTAVSALKMGRPQVALESLRGVKAQFRDGPYLAYMAEVHSQMKNTAQAEEFALLAMKKDPDNFDVVQQVCVIYHHHKHYMDALKLGQKLVAIKPDDAGSWSNLGNDLYALWRTDQARDAYFRAIKLDARHTAYYSNLATLEFREGNLGTAEALYLAAIDLDSSNAVAQHGLGMLYLTRGEFKQGFELYEWRWKAGDDIKAFPWPRWYGQKMGNFRLMLMAEQGYGDTFLMLRYFPMLQMARIDVTLGCHTSLHPLISALFPWVKLAKGYQETDEFDYFCHIMGLPYIFGTRAATVPTMEMGHLIDSCPGVGISPAKTLKLKIGYAWKGNPEQDDDRRRSMDRYEFLAVFNGIDRNKLDLVSLQKGEGVDFKDWMDTARTIAYCDLVVTVDTGVAHLAALLGKPVFVLLSRPCYWVYGLGETCPFWRTMKLFRQETRYKWGTVVKRVNDALKELLG